MIGIDMATGYYIDSNGDLRLKNDDVPKWETLADPVSVWQQPSTGTAAAQTAPTGNTPSTRGTVPAGMDPSAYPWDINTDTKADDPLVFFHLSDIAFKDYPFTQEDGSIEYADITWDDLQALFPKRTLPRTQSDLNEALPGFRLALEQMFDPDNPLDPDDVTTSGGGGGGSRGRSGGTAAEPVYLAPNREEVAEQLKSYIVATTGQNNEFLLNKAVDAYLAEDKAAWNLQMSGKGGVLPSPFMAAKELVRDSFEYKAIHQLRPDSVDEMDWVTKPQAKLRSLGLSAERASSLGIDQAQSGSNDAALVEAAEMANVADTGRLLQSQRQGLVNSARAVMGLI